MLADAPYFQAVAQVELDGGIVDVLRLQQDGPAAAIACPVAGAVEKQGADHVAAKLAPNDDIFDTCERSPLLHTQQDYSRNLSIGQGDIPAIDSGNSGFDGL